jgi:hypothetical protein
VATHETRVADRCSDGALHAADIGDEAARGGEHPLHLGHQSEYGSCHKRDLSIWIETISGNESQVEGLGGALGILIVATHSPSALGEGTRNGATNEAKARDIRPTWC